MSDWVAVVNVGVVIVLVLVTWKYMVSTGDIAKGTRDLVRESVKDRRIRRTEKALEEFYLPLLELDMWEGWKKYPYPPDFQLRSKWDTSKVLRVPSGGLADLKRFWLGVNSHRYLTVVGGTKELLIRFFQESENYWIHDESERGGMEKSLGALLVAVKDDVELLEGRLKELHPVFPEVPRGV